MDYFESMGRTTADDLGEKIVKFFAKFDDYISITDYWAKDCRVIFQLKLKKNTRKVHLYAHAPDVQQRLKLPVFQLMEYKFVLYLIVSEHKITYPTLCDVLYPHANKGVLARYALPYVIGHDPIGQLITADLVKCNHLLIGGSTGSGKSAHLHALITSLAYMKQPDQVNFVMIDVGTNDLRWFRELPHLSCPIAKTRDEAYQILTALNRELERRRALEESNSTEFSKLPRIVLVIDEFPALFSSADKNSSRLIVDIISGFLQRGRHAKIHVVLSAQNPTLKNMKVDLSNITTRVAFRCAKRNFSETILDEPSAELLSGNGDLLFKSPMYDGAQRAQGIFIKSEEILRFVHRYNRVPHHTTNMFKIPSAALEVKTTDTICEDDSILQPLPRKPLSEDRQFAEIMLWALSRNSVSTNSLMNEHRMGWNKALRTIHRLEELGVIEPLEGKQARHVIPSKVGDLTDNILDYLHQNGINDEHLIKGFASR